MNREHFNGYEDDMTIVLHKGLYRLLAIGVFALLFSACASNPQSAGGSVKATDDTQAPESDTSSHDDAEDTAFVKKAPGYLIQPGDILSV
jgi:hypothetical protein